MNGAAKRHLDDAAIVQLLDAEVAEEEKREHLESCSVCGARTDELRVRTEALRQVLTAADRVWGEAPSDLWDRIQRAHASPRGAKRASTGRRQSSLHPRRWTPLLKAAAVAGVLLAGGLSAEPVREWIRRTAEQLLGGGGESDSTVATPPGGEEAVAVRARFVPQGPVLVIRIDEPQVAGTLTVSFETRDDAQGQILTADPDADLVVNPDGFRAVNGPGVDWSYRFDVPEGLDRVAVWVGGRLVRSMTPADGVVHVVELDGG